MESLERLTLVAENSADLVLILDGHGVVEYASPSVDAILGWTAEEVIGRPMASFLDPEVLGGCAGGDWGRPEADAPRRVEAALVRRDGGRRWMSIRTHTRRGDDSRPTCQVVALTDVQERHDAEAALAVSEERFRQAMDHAPIGMALVAPDGRFTRVNAALCRFLGRSPVELVGLTWQELTHPDDLEPTRRFRDDLASSDRSADRILKRYVRPDGGVVWGDLELSVVRSASGAVEHFVAQIVDMTETVAARARLEESERRFRFLAETATDVFYVTSLPDHRVEWVAPTVSRALGWSPDEILGRDFLELSHPDDRAAVEALRRDFALREAELAGSSVVTRYRTKAGGYRSFVGRAELVHDGPGGPTAIAVSLRDVDDLVTARREADDERARLRATLDSLMDPHVLLSAVRDETGTIVDFEYADANPAACRFNRQPYEKLVGTRLLDLHPGATNSPVLEAWRRAIETGEPVVLDGLVYREEMFGGEERVFDIRAVRFGDGVSVMYRDVTDRYEFQRRLLESEARYRLLAENASDTVLRCQPDGRIDWVSPGVERLLGWRVDQVVGRAALSFVHPLDRHLTERLEFDDDGSLGPFRVRALTAAAEPRWVELTARRVVEDGRPTAVVVGCRDVEIEVEAQQALGRSEAKFRLAMQYAPVGMAIVGLDRSFSDVNPALVRMVGYDADWLREHRIPDVLHPDDNSTDLEMRAEVFAGTAMSSTRTVRFVARDGSVVWVDHQVGLLRDDGGAPRSYISQFVNVTDSRQAQERLSFLATHDTLTQLANRRELLTHMDAVLTHQPRTGHLVAVLFCDLDGLKAVNDRYGHATGDKVLVEVARRLRNHVRSTDAVGRLGGDEFVVVLSDTRDVDDAVAVAAVLHRVLAERIEVDGISVGITVSVGIAVADPERDADTVLRMADKALYRAKREGRNRTAVFDPDLDEDPAPLT